MATEEKRNELDELTTPQPDSDDPAYLAHVQKKIEQGRADFENGRTLSEKEVWKELGVEP